MTREINYFDPASFERAAILLRARKELRPTGNWYVPSPEAEGGCGVTGFASTVPVGGKHIYQPSIQMRNRGNGKGGGIAACGLVAEDMRVSEEILQQDYILQIALLDPGAQKDIEDAFIKPNFEIHQSYMVPTVDDYREVELLELRPPDVMRYFVRVKKDVLNQFRSEKGMESFKDREVEDEYVYQNTNKLNEEFYAKDQTMKGFVVSHARNLIIMKIVGFAEAAVQYYRMEDTRAHVWIAHQRYPTRGRVWHPGGAHPFIGMNEALVHNGDFANYHAISEYLSSRNLFPKFMTDTELSVLIFDLLNRTYGYPLEYIIEALAPTTETDFDRLPKATQKIYSHIQSHHVHASPDGPWFFIIARSLADNNAFEMVGITDTAMLRPQVFALQEGDVSIGLVCSEKQAVDATLLSLSKEDSRFTPVADRYWNARGGSYKTGGSFKFTINPKNGTSGSSATREYTLRTSDKFDNVIHLPEHQVHYNLSTAHHESKSSREAEYEQAVRAGLKENDSSILFEAIKNAVAKHSYDDLCALADQIVEQTGIKVPALGIEALTLAMDHRYPLGDKKRSSVIFICRDRLEKIFSTQPLFGDDRESPYKRVTWDTKDKLAAPVGIQQTLLIDAKQYEPEGEDCDARVATRAHELGWKHLVHYNTLGTRFHAAGFGPDTFGLRIDCYDNPGDYLGSGMDGLEVYVHGNAQDQLCQIAKQGKLVVYGDVGQTFLYGAKGGIHYVMGNTAGRPLVNAVGRPKAIINGTTLDYLAESFMAGDPLEDGGFVVLNGLRFDDEGNLKERDLPFPGSNLLSLASGGVIYVRDPHRTLIDGQLNGGMYCPLEDEDWKLILPYLKENERLFGIEVDKHLLTVNGVKKSPKEVYQVVMPKSMYQERNREESESTQSKKAS